MSLLRSVSSSSLKQLLSPQGGAAVTRLYSTKEEKVERSELLKEQLKKGYFFGLKDMLNKSQKKFEATNEASRPEISLKLMPIPVTTLQGKNVDVTEQTAGKVSLLLFGFSDHTKLMTTSFATPFLQKFEKDPLAQCFEITIANPWLNFMKGMFISALKKQVPPERHPYTSFFMKESMFLEKHLGIDTKFVGYAYLIDKQSRIRWRAHENASPNEITSLLKLTETLKRE